MAKRSPEPTSISDLTEKQAKAEHARLHAEISEHDKRYYADDAPTVSRTPNTTAYASAMARSSSVSRTCARWRA